MIRALFNFDGRMNRKPWWLWGIGLTFAIVAAFFLVAIVAGIVIGIKDPNIADDKLDTLLDSKLKLPFILILLASFWPCLAITVKRLNDRNRPSWLAMPLLAPSYLQTVIQMWTGNQSLFPVDTPLMIVLSAASGLTGLWALIELGFMRGTEGPNPHGPDPLGATPPPTQTS